MKTYYVNNDQTQNPGWHHEVHTAEHASELRIRNKTLIGFYDDEVQAVQAAKRIYRDADGCIDCCPRVHRG